MQNRENLSVPKDFPFPIAYHYNRFDANRRRLKPSELFTYFIAAYESTLRFLSTVMLSNYVRDGLWDADLNDRLAGIWNKNVQLGNLVEILREILRVYHRERSELLFLRELDEFYFYKKNELTRDADRFESIVKPRNEYVHGGLARAPNKKIEEVLVEESAHYDASLLKMGFLKHYQLIIPQDLEGRRISKIWDRTGNGTELESEQVDIELTIDGVEEWESLLLVDRRDHERQLLLNPFFLIQDQADNDAWLLYAYEKWDKKKKRLEYINAGKWMEGSNSLTVDIARDDDQWCQVVQNFQQIFEKLSAVLEFMGSGSRITAQKTAFDGWLDTQEGFIEIKKRFFIGREKELQCIDAFLNEEKSGYLLIQGPAGQGKSSLMVRVMENRSGIGHFVTEQQGQNEPVLIVRFILHQLIEKYGLDEDIPEDVVELKPRLGAVMKRISANLRGNSEVLIVDGLDEMPHSAREDFFTFFPETLPTGIYTLFSARSDRGMVEGQLTKHLKRPPFSLSALSEEGCRRLIRERMRDRTNEDLLRKLYQVSEGNALFLQCLVDQIEMGNLDSQDELPADIQRLFLHFLNRLERLEGNQECILDVLGILVVTRMPLSIDELKGIWKGKYNRREIATSIRHISYMLIFEDDSVRLFHSLFREFLVTSDHDYAFDSEELSDYHSRMIGYCQPWQEKNYSRYLPYHLWEIGDWEGFARLIEEADEGMKKVLLSYMQFQLAQVTEDGLQGSKVMEMLGFLGNSQGNKEKDFLLRLVSMADSYGKWGFLSEVYEGLSDCWGHYKKGKLLLHLGSLLKEQGRYELAERRLQESVKLLEQEGKSGDLAQALTELGSVYGRQGELDRATVLSLEGLEKSSEDADGLRAQSRCYSDLGFWASRRGDFRDAEAHYGRAVELARKAGDSYMLNRGYHNFGHSQFQLGKIPEGLRNFLEVLEIRIKQGFQGDLERTCGTLGFCLVQIGSYDPGLDYLLFSLELAGYLQEKTPFRIIQRLGQLVYAYRSRGDFDEARKYGERVENLVVQRNDDIEKANAYNECGMMYTEMGEDGKGMELLDRVRDMTEQISGDTSRVMAVNNMYRARGFFQAGDMEKARSCAGKSYEIIKEKDFNIKLPAICQVRAQIEEADGQVQAARMFREEADEARRSWRLDEVAKLDIPQLPPAEQFA